MTPALLEAAAANNAAWCDLVCRAHGLPTTPGRRLWSTARRSPDGYPDAVTIAADVGSGEALGGVDTSPGCSIKDSSARLDLSRHGFEALFEAQWIHRPSPPTGRPRLAWASVSTPAELAAWSTAHGAPGVLPSSLLGEPGVRLVAAREAGEIVAGAALNLSGGDVVGVSNVFAVGADPDVVWSDLVGVARRAFGSADLVGYEAGDDLRPALRAGFATIGPLRVWLRG